MFLRHCAVTATLVVLATHAATAAEKWVRYTNQRFGTSAEFPADLVSPEPPPANGSGQTYVSEDGLIRISIFGSFLVLVENFEAYRQDRLNLADESGIEVTYSAGGKGWFVYSGLKDGEIVYFKSIPACGGEAAGHIVLTYPQNRKEFMDPIVERVASSLQSQQGSDCP